MLRKLGDLDASCPIDFVSEDESSGRQFAKKRLNLERVEREQLALDALRPVFEAPFTVSESPQAGEAKARGKRALSKVFVLEEAGLDVAGTCHY
jgi:hypothetical protein